VGPGGTQHQRAVVAPVDAQVDVETEDGRPPRDGDGDHVAAGAVRGVRPRCRADRHASDAGAGRRGRRHADRDDPPRAVDPGDGLVGRRKRARGRLQPLEVGLDGADRAVPAGVLDRRGDRRQ